MYDGITTNAKADWLTLIVGIVVVIFLILLLIWIFPIINYRNSDVVLSERIYAENIEMMQNAANNYFLLEGLPNKLGDSKVITLKDMYDRDLILELVDSEGNPCQEYASYAQVTKLANKYKLEVILECKGNTDTIVSYFNSDCNLN